MFKRRKKDNSTILSNVKSNGSIVISNITVSGKSVSDSTAEQPPGRSLHRGSKYDLEFKDGSSFVTLGMNSQVDVGRFKYRPQAFPTDPKARFEHLKIGVTTPYGVVTGIEYRHETSLWAVLTDRYPDGVTYTPGDSAILCRKGKR